MVKVRDDLPKTPDGEFDQFVWLAQIQSIAKLPSTIHLQLACERVVALPVLKRLNRTGWQGSDCFNAGLSIVQILAELRMDEQTLVTGMLYRAVREERLSMDEIADEFGPGIVKLIDGVLRMAAISAYVHPRNIEDLDNPDFDGKRQDPVLGKRINQVHSLRKMLVAMVDDVRVALIKLAERTCAIRALKDAPLEKQERVSREIFDIYAPLAHRLGIGHLKWELEDLSFRYLKPDQYKMIAKQLDERRLDRQHYIDELVVDLKKTLLDAKIYAEVTGRAKHIYSIWRKMQRKHLSFHQIYDIRAVRVLVPEVPDCYATLGLVHARWRHIPKEFDDYIATPKENGYRSLHTAVLGPGGRVIEVQIRTFDMHDEAELGVCAHHVYKEGAQGHVAPGQYEDKILWLRQVLEWHENLGEADADNLLAHLSQEAVDDRVYVFTRDGHIVDLGAEATPLDFAYHVHTEVGHRCRGAKVNGRIVPLSYRLHTGEQVEILTGRESAPSRDWLNPHLGYITSAKARAKIQQWFKMQDRDVHLRDGRIILERELDRVSMRHVNLQDVASSLNLKNADDLYVALARGDLKVGRVLQAVQVASPFEHRSDKSISVRSKEKGASKTQSLEVEGVADLLSQTAGCCKPLPGDPVKGYISVGRGVIVHKESCSELARLSDKEPIRIIDVDWHGDQHHGYPVDLLLQAYDRKGLLRDVSMLLAEMSVNVMNFSTNTNPASHFNTMRLSIEIEGLDQLGRLMTKLGQLPNVVTVKRC